MEPFHSLLVFLNLLQSKKIQFALTQSRDDAIMVSFATFGARYEVEILDDGPVYCFVDVKLLPMTIPPCSG